MIRETSASSIFVGGGEMGSLMRSHPWAATPLGPVESWPQPLRTMASAMFDAQHPMAIFWGQALTTLCNDGYRRSLQVEDPLALLAKPGPEVWARAWGTEVRDTLQATATQAMATGNSSGLESLQMLIWQSDRQELAEHPFSYSPIRTESGEIAGLLCVGSYPIRHNLSERQRTAEAIADSERRFRRVVESNIFGAICYRITGELTYANEYVLDMLGYSAQEVESGQVRWDELTPPEFAPLDRRAIDQVRAEGRCSPYEKVFLHKDGRAVPVLIVGALLQTPFDQNPEGSAFVLNLTELKRVTEERDRFFELSPDLLAIGHIVNGEVHPNFTFGNQAWERIMGYSPQEIVSQPFISFIHPDDEASTLQVAQQIAAGETQFNFENRYRHRDGTYRWLAWNVTTVSAQNRFYALARDVTDRKQAAAERETLLATEQTARAAAERANRIKDEFLAVVSHELRSPLNPIVGWSQLLKRGLSPEKTKLALDTIERNAKLQVQLISDLLDISKLLRGKLSINEAPVDLAAVVPNALETVRQDAAAKSIQIETDLTTCSVIGDAVRLQQVVWNLLTNAVKFTPAGGSVTVRLSAEANQLVDAPEAVIRVIDTGRGISGEFLPYVFEHFHQENYATTRQFGGLGLGLAIVRQIVEMHNGTVAVDSLGENQGATFTVRLPLVPMLNNPLPATLATNEGDLSGVRILLVEDDPDSQEITVFALELASATVTAVASGAAALEAMNANVPDILISDVGMPDMDGYMLISQVRQRTQAAGQDVRAIALTAYAGEGDEQRALDAGFQRYLTKPIDPDRLIRIIRSLLNAKNPCPKDKDS
ncbi:MAG: PAS domain S-box protein [Phormidesmis sp.]